MNVWIRSRWLAVAAGVACAAAFAPLAAADAVYHSEHLDLSPFGGAPLRSGFVQNIKAEGPQIYAREVFVLNGAAPNTTYAVWRNFFFGPECVGGVFPSKVAELRTNAAGNASANLVVVPEQVAGFEGDHGVKWTVENPVETVVYDTTCTLVTLD